ncbi:MAG: hypothetical protein ACRCVX_01420 [Shewanella sp.]
MGKYLTMKKVFWGNVKPEDFSVNPVCVDERFDDGVHPHKYAAHAINSHDELVAEVERLRLMISECYPYIKDRADWGNEYEVDLANRLFDAAK